jgi:ABC-type lipoprotein release transport system permease subunit
VGGAVRSILFGPAANAFMSASADAVTGWVMETVNDRLGLAMSLTVAEPAKDLRSVAFCANGQSFVSVATDGQPRLRYSGPRFSIKTWAEHDLVFMEAVAMERFLQALILSLILVLAEFFIFALVFTMVSEKRRDIGIMKAVGFTSRQVSAVFLVIGLSIGVFGGLLGVGGGLLFAHYINPIREFIKWTIGFDPFPSQLYYFTEVPSHVTLGSVLAVGGGAIICALLFSIVPAIHAARMDPVRTLHYE